MSPGTQGIHVGEADLHPGFAGTCILLGVKEAEAKWDTAGGSQMVLGHLNRALSLCGRALM